MSEQIGVLVSHGFGAGWSTRNSPECALDQELVQAFEDNLSEDKIMEIARINWPDNYMGGLMDCSVYWIDKGTKYRITEYDGAESIEFDTSDYWSVT
jgi:hypothetical protein